MMMMCHDLVQELLKGQKASNSARVLLFNVPPPCVVCAKQLRRRPMTSAQGLCLPCIMHKDNDCLASCTRIMSALHHAQGSCRPCIKHKDYVYLASCTRIMSALHQAQGLCLPCIMHQVYVCLASCTWIMFALHHARSSIKVVRPAPDILEVIDPHGQCYVLHTHAKFPHFASDRGIVYIRLPCFLNTAADIARCAQKSTRHALPDILYVLQLQYNVL